MSNYPSIKSSGEDASLKLRLSELKKELEYIEFKTNEFEATLRAHLMDVIIEERELTVLYKQQKAAKKLKRLAQKHKAKGQESALQIKTPARISKARETDKALRKKLYREAMLQVHPDKFLLEEGKHELATEMTTQLISLYTTGSLAELEAFHKQIFSGQKLSAIESSDTQLLEEIERVKKEIEEAKAQHTYIVLSTYANPMDFLKELQAYYEDRLFKLRKRTRTL